MAKWSLGCRHGRFEGDVPNATLWGISLEVQYPICDLCLAIDGYCARCRKNHPNVQLQALQVKLAENSVVYCGTPEKLTHTAQ